MTRSRSKRIAAITMFCTLIGARSGSAQVVDSNLWGVNGTVRGILRAGDTQNSS
jgi:hypothetical protein